jgi:PBP1b-binding outer membrane lipoprotein LpoB
MKRSIIILIILLFFSSCSISLNNEIDKQNNNIKVENKCEYIDLTNNDVNKYIPY